MGNIHSDYGHFPYLDIAYMYILIEIWALLKNMLFLKL